MNNNQYSLLPGLVDIEVNAQQEAFDESGIEEPRANVRRKRPYPSQKQKDIILSAILERVMATLEKKKNEDPTIADCIASLRQVLEIEEASRLFFFACTTFRVKENREVWMALEKNDIRI